MQIEAVFGNFIFGLEHMIICLEVGEVCVLIERLI